MNFYLMFCLIVTAALTTAENFRSAYIVNKENRRLARQAVKKIDSPSLLSCSQACLRHSWCTSTNFRESFGKRLGTGHCELHKYGLVPRRLSFDLKMCAQRKAGRRQRARRLADLVFKIAARVMADQYAIFKISSALFICEF